MFRSCRELLVGGSIHAYSQILYFSDREVDEYFWETILDEMSILHVLQFDWRGSLRTNFERQSLRYSTAFPKQCPCFWCLKVWNLHGQINMGRYFCSNTEHNNFPLMNHLLHSPLLAQSIDLICISFQGYYLTGLRVRNVVWQLLWPLHSLI